MISTYRESWRGSSRWIVLEEWEGKVPLPDAPDGWASLPGAEIRKASAKKTSIAVSGPGGSFLVKIYWPRNILDRLFSFSRPSPAFREVALYRELEKRGVPTSLPVAAGERRGAGVPGPSCLVARPAPGSTPLDQLLLDGEARGTRRRRLIEEYGAFARAIHDRGVLQEDFDPNNAIALEPVGGTRKIHLVDMERVRLASALSEDERARNLARLLRYGRTLPLTEQIRFLRGYLASEGEPGRALQRWAGAIRVAWAGVVRRDRERMDRVCLRRGRLFLPFIRGEVRGIFRVRFGEREEPIFDSASLDGALEWLKANPKASDPVTLEAPIRTRAGPFQATLIPCAPGAARKRWQRVNGDLKESRPATLPLALVEVTRWGRRRRGYLLVARSETYRPPGR